MPTDAKCGLLVGLGLVLAVAVLFFQKDPPPTESPVTPAAAMKPPVEDQSRPVDSPMVPGRPVSRTARTIP